MKDVISVDTILGNVEDWHGFRDEAIANLPESTQKFVDDTSWAGEELKAERLKLAKQAMYSLLISKLPEKKEVELTVPEEWTIGYNLCLDDIRKSIDEMFNKEGK